MHEVNESSVLRTELSPSALCGRMVETLNSVVIEISLIFYLVGRLPLKHPAMPTFSAPQALCLTQ